MKPYISVIIPVYQGAKTLKSLYKRLPDDSFEEDAEDVFAKQMGMF